MSFISKSEMIRNSDVSLPKPLKYPGKFNHNNKNGTRLSKQEWLTEEVKKWIVHMKSNDKYDNTYLSVKAKILDNWLKKTFNKLSIDDVTKMLYDCEGTIDDKQTDHTQEHEDQDSDSDTEVEVPPPDDENIEDTTMFPDSPDMFEDTSDTEMETDQQLTRNEKEAIIQNHIHNIDRNMLINQDSLPKFVQES